MLGNDEKLLILPQGCEGGGGWGLGWWWGVEMGIIVGAPTATYSIAQRVHI